MPYPNTPDWMSGTPLSGWYLWQQGGGQASACSSDGWDLLSALQSELHDRLGADGFGPQPTYDGTSVDDTSVPFNDPSTGAVGWNPALLRAMYAVGQHVGLGSDYLSAIQSDAQSGTGPVSAATLQVGIWMADRLYHSQFQSGGDVYGVQVSQPSIVSIPQGTNYPSMDTAPPQVPGATGGSYGSSCNAIPPNTAALIPVVQTVTPFSFNELLVIGLAVLAIGAVVVATRFVPVKSQAVKSELAESRLRSSRR